jgi:hypothetical protein
MLISSYILIHAATHWVYWSVLKIKDNVLKDVSDLNISIHAPIHPIYSEMAGFIGRCS